MRCAAPLVSLLLSTLAAPAWADCPLALGRGTAELVAVDVEVSEEGRGKLQHLKIVPGIDGRYRAEGMLLVARGRWGVIFDVRSGEETERLTHEIVLK